MTSHLFYFLQNWTRIVENSKSICDLNILKDGLSSEHLPPERLHRQIICKRIDHRDTLEALKTVSKEPKMYLVCFWLGFGVAGLSTKHDGLLLDRILCVCFCEAFKWLNHHGEGFFFFFFFLLWWMQPTSHLLLALEVHICVCVCVCGLMAWCGERMYFSVC